MEPRYLWLLHYPTGSAMVIKLTKQELEESRKYNDFESFITECLEDKYNFNLNDCIWMTSEEYQYERFGF